MNKTNEAPVVFWIDLFSGAGGTSTGVHFADTNAAVVACVNHDSDAISAHLLNHPDCLHFVEDIRDFQVVLKLKKIVAVLREKYPDCIINIWASLECTHFSKAKGGLARDADSRTLAWDLLMYLEHLKPDYLYIENVSEFLSWGPLSDKGQPIKELKGCDYARWVKTVEDYGFAYEYAILNSADYGAVQTRRRYFGIFASGGLPINFPKGTHYDPKKFRNSAGGFEFNKEPWRPVRDVLQLEDKGRSIFERKKLLAEATMERIYAGLQKFGKSDGFMKRYNGGDPNEKVKSLDRPSGSISTVGRHAIVQPQFLTEYYGNGKPQSIEKPCPTVPTKDRFALNYLLYDYSSFTASSMESPAGTVTTVPKHNLVTHEWLTDTQYGRVGQGVDKPCFTLIARMDKKPPYYVKTERGEPRWEFSPEDSLIVFKIKHFMRVHGIKDIKMRMLNLLELKRIQGFPDEYKLFGTLTNQKKQIGNAVEVNQAKALVTANYNALCV